MPECDFAHAWAESESVILRMLKDKFSFGAANY